jgi:hypothetical protein
MHDTTLKQGSCNSSALTGQTGQHHRSDRWATCEQDQHSDRSDRSDRCATEPRNGSKPPENLLNASNKPFQAQTSPPCWQCMNQGKMRKVSTNSFSNIQNLSQDGTHVQMSKLGTLQVHNDLNYMITKVHNHWTMLKRI